MHYIILALKFIAWYFATSTILTALAWIHICRGYKKGRDGSSGDIGLLVSLFVAWPITGPYFAWVNVLNAYEYWRYTRESRRRLGKGRVQ